MKLNALAAPVLLASSIALTACGGAEAPAEEAVEEGIPGLTVSDAQMVLNAVEGNPAAVYFNLKYEGDRGLAIRKASVEGAGSTMLHEYGDNQGRREMMEALPITLTKGTELAFEPGSRHVMVMEPGPELAAGNTANVTLTVSGGGTSTFTAEIVAAGDADR